MSADTAMSDEPSIFDSGSSIRSFSDTSSIAGSVLSNVSQKTQRLFGRKLNARTWSDSTTSPTEPSSSSTAYKQKGSFTCGFCAEEDIATTCTRKNDLKRHIEDFHHKDAQWFCRQRNCGMVFDWEGAYKSHFKSAHGGTRTTMMLDDAKVALCPQLVFACGFLGCTAVFEATGPADSAATFKEYVGHVVKHFDEPATATQWTHSWRISNLLRQDTLAKLWAKATESSQDALGWMPRSSAALRKRLETRHLANPVSLVQYAALLGSGKLSLPDQPLPPHLLEVAKTPARDGCPCLLGLDAADPTDPMMFRIQRANNTPNNANNRHLRDYMASQRSSARVLSRPNSSARGRAAPPQPYSNSMRTSMSSTTTTTTPPPAMSAHYLSPLPPGVQLGSSMGSQMFDAQYPSTTTMGMMPPVTMMGGGGIDMPVTTADVAMGLAAYQEYAPGMAFGGGQSGEWIDGRQFMD